MPFPDSAPFREFLSKTRADAVQSEGSFEVVGRPPRELYLRYPEGELQLDSVLKVIRSELRGVGHPTGRQIELAVLALLVETCSSEADPIKHANATLRRVVPGRHHHAIVTKRLPPPDGPLKLGAYQLGPFDAEKLSYWARRTGAAWPVDLGSLSRFFSVQREPRKVPLIEWDRADLYRVLSRRWLPLQITERVLDSYYGAMHDHFHAEVSTELNTTAASSMLTHAQVVAAAAPTAIGAATAPALA